MLLRRAIAAAVLVCCLLPAAASANYEDVIRDCVANGKLSKRYTQKEYRDALAKMTTDAAQYYGCPDIIKRAQRQSASSDDDGNNSSSAGAGADSNQGSGPTPDEQTQAQQDLADAQHLGANYQRIADVDVRPGELAYRDFGAVSKLPTPLAVLGLLLLGAAIAVCLYSPTDTTSQASPIAQRIAEADKR